MGESHQEDEANAGGWRDVLDQLSPRRPILATRCGELLAARHPGVGQATLQDLVIRLDDALYRVRTADRDQGAQALRDMGSWATGENLAFDLLADATHLYKKVSIPWLVRAYPGVEGFVDGLLALDELLTAAVTRLADGYFTQHNSQFRK